MSCNKRISKQIIFNWWGKWVPHDPVIPDTCPNYPIFEKNYRVTGTPAIRLRHEVNMYRYKCNINICNINVFSCVIFKNNDYLVKILSVS